MFRVLSRAVSNSAFGGSLVGETAPVTSRIVQGSFFPSSSSCGYVRSPLLFGIFSEKSSGSSSARFSSSASQSSAESNGTCKQGEEVAIFAGGCFWGLELAFQRVHGVLRTRVGYTQGHKPNPTYREVCTGTTGHTEAVKIIFDPSTVAYEALLDVFWKRIDPTLLNRQGNDVGTQYRTGIYVTTVQQKEKALASKEEIQKQLGSSKQVVTEIEEADTFWDAEEYHQRYLEKGGQSAKKGDATPIRCYG